MKSLYSTIYKFLHIVVLIADVLVCLASDVHTYDTEYRYGVMLDLGSSSTKLRLYKWPVRRSVYELPVVTDFYNGKYKPSLTTFSDSVSRIPGYLQPMIEAAVEKIPDDKVSSTPIYAIATAGMRTLNSTWSRRVFKKVRSYLSNKTACPFMFSPRQARISSGEEEGAFAWISLNYLKGTFSKENARPSDFTGVLEMGGGSTQITFLPDGPLYAGKFPVQIAGKIYPLYTHSYLMYGQNFINVRVNSYLVRSSPGRPTLYNPCMLKGDKRVYQTVEIFGSGDWRNCENILSVFLATASDDWCHPKPCAIGRTYQPSVAKKQFHAISGFVYSPKDLGMGPTLIPAELQQKAIRYCNMTLGEAVAQGIPERFASTLCLMGLYIPKLLTEAYRFPAGTRAITASNTYQGNTISWTMGAMLYEIEQLEFRSDDDDDGPIDAAPVCSSTNYHSSHTLAYLISFLVILQLSSGIDEFL